MKKLYIYTLDTLEDDLAYESKQIGLALIKNLGEFTAIQTTSWESQCEEIYYEQQMFSQFQDLGIKIIHKPLTKKVARYILDNAKNITLSSTRKNLYTFLNYSYIDGVSLSILLHIVAKKKLKVFYLRRHISILKKEANLELK